MNCSKCGNPITPEDQFCKNCGASTVEMNAQPEQPVVQPEAPMQPDINTQPEMNAQPEMSAMPAAQPAAPAQPVAQPATQPTKKSPLPIIIAVVVVFVIVLVGVIVMVVLPMINNRPGNGTGTTNNGGGSQVTPVSKSNYKVSFKQFTFQIPDDLIYEIKENTLLIGDEQNTWAVQLNVYDGNFSTLKDNKSQIHTSLSNDGLNVKPAELKTIEGTEFLTLEVSEGSQSFLYAYAKLNSMKIAGLAVLNQDYTIDYNILNKVASVVSTAQYSESTNSISNFKTIDMKPLKKAIK